MRSFLNRIVTRARVVWRKIPTALRSGWITAAVTFVGALATITVGILPVLANAIASRNFEPFFDSLSLGSTAAVSAALAFVSGLGNTVWRWARPIAAAYQTTPPPAPPG